MARQHVEPTEWSDWHRNINFAMVVPVVFQIGQFEHVTGFVHPITPVTPRLDIKVRTSQGVIHDLPLVGRYRCRKIQILERLRALNKNFLIFRCQEIHGPHTGEIDVRIGRSNRCLCHRIPPTRPSLIVSRCRSWYPHIFVIS